MPPPARPRQAIAICGARRDDVSIIDAAALASIDTNGGSRDPIEGWDAADAVAEWQDLTALRKAASELSKPYVVNDVIRTVADVDTAKREDVPPKQKPEAGPDRDPKAEKRNGERKERKTKKTNVADDKRRETQADKLIALASAAELFHTADKSCYADIEINGHRETWKVPSQGFKRWLRRRYFEETKGAVNGEAMQNALGVIEALAYHDGPEQQVHIRVGGIGGRLYLDLCDDGWRAVEIAADGWRVVSNPPVRFRRAPGMLPLPTPIAGGSIDALRAFLNVASEDDFVLAVSWTLAALRDRGPYPVLALAGEQGAAKSTFSAVVRSLADPSKPLLRSLPREDRDIFISANNSHVLAFNNISALPSRRAEEEFWEAFEAARPRILGALLDGVAHGIDRLPRICLERLPRMADFAKWAVACETRVLASRHLHECL